MKCAITRYSKQSYYKSGNFTSIMEAKKVYSTGEDTVEEALSYFTDSHFFSFFQFFGGSCHQH